MSKPNRPPNENDPICEAENCPKPDRHFVPLHKNRPQRFHDNECKGLAMVTRVWVTCTGVDCDKQEEKRPDVLTDGKWTCITCANKARGQNERTRWEAKSHGVGVEPAHMPGIGPCTLFTGTIGKDGYGVFPLADARQKQAHIYAWELEHGPITDGSCVCHHCDIRACIRLDHLFLDTRAGNTEDMVSKDRQAKGVRMALAILTDERVRVVRADYATGEYSQQDLADREGVSQNTISSAVRRATWSHVP